MAHRLIDDEAQDRQARRAGFRLSAKNLLLTWPHCPVDKDEALNQLRNYFPYENVIAIVVGRELHQDGTPHLHAYVSLRAKCNIRNSSALDLRGEDGTLYHGNYQAARSGKAAYEYVTKDGDYTVFGEVESFETLRQKRENHLAAIEQCTSEQEFLAYVFLNGLSSSAQILRPYWQNSRRTKLRQALFDPESFLELPTFEEHLQRARDEDKALLVIGPTGIGKTQWIIHRFREEQTIRVTAWDDLRNCAEDTKVVIFDDFAFGERSRQDLLHLFDVPTARSVRCRYSNGLLAPRTTMILIGNSVELVLGTFQEDPAVMRRFLILQLPDEKLWR